MITTSSNKERKMSAIRHKTNPFLEDMTIAVKTRNVRISSIGKDDNILVNQSTGEVSGTHLTTVKRVDGEQFVKLFTANIGLTFDLTSAGIKTFTVLIWCVQHKAISKDEIDLDSFALEDFLLEHKSNKPPIKVSIATFKRGLNELEKSSIIAKTIRAGRYFINPNFVFNGDRIAFTTLIERKNDPQIDMLDNPIGDDNDE
jgi:hypothetical protein